MRLLDAMHALLSRAPRWVSGTLAMALVAAVGLLDGYSGAEISSSVFYVAPIGLAAWYAGARWGFAASIAAAVVWYLADVSAGHGYSAAWIPVWNATVRLSFFVIIGDLLRRLHAAMDVQRWLAETDTLTGLFNARRFLEAADAEVARSARYHRPVSLAYIDLDGFKGINDRHGHQTGDAVLEVVGATLRAQVRTTDVAGRLGGDEFAVLFPETDAPQAREAVAKLRMSLDAAMTRRQWQVGFSIGVATSVGGALPGEALLRRADQLMYEVKRTGRGGASFGGTGTDGPVTRG